MTVFCLRILIGVALALVNCTYCDIYIGFSLFFIFFIILCLPVIGYFSVISHGNKRIEMVIMNGILDVY
jgi:hypothetical protein